MWRTVLIALALSTPRPAGAQPGPAEDVTVDDSTRPAPTEAPLPRADAPPPEEDETEPPFELGPPSSEDRAGALLELARARAEAGDGGFAIEALERFLEVHPYDARASDVTAELARLRKAKTRVHVATLDTPATVWIGGSRVADRTPAWLELEPGRHRLVVIARDGRREERELVLPPASRRSVEIVFPGAFDPLVERRFGAGEPLLVPLPEEEEEAASSARGRRRVVALAGLSSSAVVLTGVFGMIALSEAESFRRDPRESVARRGERAAILADVALGVALTTGLTALVLKLRDREAKPAKKASSEVSRRRGGGIVRGGAL